eukprot:3702833-Pleurochrysis_carterae.AAC.1
MCVCARTHIQTHTHIYAHARSRKSLGRNIGRQRTTRFSLDELAELRTLRFTGGGDADARAHTPCACDARLQNGDLQSSLRAAPPASPGSAAPLVED